MASEYLQHPQIDPIIFSLGPLDLRWYGLMYLLGAVFAYIYGTKRAKRDPNWTPEAWQDLLFWAFLALVIGGRVGYVLFYQFPVFISNPLYLFDMKSGGMSFHGGLLGVIVALALYARKLGLSVWQVGDFVAPLVPVGLGLGRIGNFINGELWGRVTEQPWGMVFAHAGPLPRHPSQLYQAFGEGLLLFALLWWFSRKPRPTGAVGGLFVVGYGVARFTVEFFREPDAHLGLLGVFSMGQWLSALMIIAGAVIMFLSYKHGGLGANGRLPAIANSKNSQSAAPSKRNKKNKG